MPARLSLAFLILALSACGHAAPSDKSTAEPPAEAQEAAAPPSPAPPRDHVVLLAGGDISFGRLVGQMLLQDPSRDFFAKLHPWLSSADLRFANLEGPLSDQHGETVKPGQPLVFTGPPAGAEALAHAGFSIVSTANNHAWDYGKPALLETIALLDRAGVRHVGTGADREASRKAEILDVGGFRVAFLAFTGIWNDGLLARHPADAFVARAEEDDIVRAVQAVRGQADAVLVSFHGGEEYVDVPRERSQRLARAAIEAGATAVLGHHPHVVQGIEWHLGRPILYSMGNLLMRMVNDHPFTGLGYMARISLRRGEAPWAQVCPYRIFGVEVLPLAGDPRREAYERLFFDHLRAISRAVGGTIVSAPDADGCALVSPPA